MTNEYFKNLKDTTKKIGKSIAALGLAGLILAESGCATPQSIKYRRYLGSQGKLNSNTYTELTANERETAVKAGININFDKISDLKAETAGATTAFLYGFARPIYKEFWVPSNPSKFEYSGLTILTGNGYINGRKAETAGELVRYLAIIAGATMNDRESKGKHEKIEPIKPDNTIPKKEDKENPNPIPPEPTPIEQTDWGTGNPVAH